MGTTAAGPRSIDLNADVGEATDPAGIAVERALLAIVTSAHVACGGHTGDAASMRATVTAAQHHGVRIGAHPSYPDRPGFGRRPVHMRTEELQTSLHEQISALVGVCAGIGTSVDSVKAHGALYGEVARGGDALTALLGAIASAGLAGTILVLPAGSPAVAIARAAGIAVSEEGFSDRAYGADGGLVDRGTVGAVVSDPTAAAGQARSLVCDGRVVTIDGGEIGQRVDTLCVHGDSPGAVAMATAVRRVLEEAGIDVAAMSISS